MTLYTLKIGNELLGIYHSVNEVLRNFDNSDKIDVYDNFVSWNKKPLTYDRLETELNGHYIAYIYKAETKYCVEKFTASFTLT